MSKHGRRASRDTCVVAADDRSHVSVGCVAPTTCQNWADVPTCAVNTPPTLERAELYVDAGGSSGHLVLWGTDATPTIRTVRGTGPDRVFEFYVVAPRFEGSSFIVDIENAIYTSAYYDVVIGDLGATPSNVVRVVPQARGVNEPCELSPTCPGGLSCQADPMGTMRCLP